MHTNHFYWKQADRENSEQFIGFLRQLHQESPDKKLIIIIDNGSIHKSRKVQAFVKKQGWIELFFLPLYSPEYNPIERLWMQIIYKNGRSNPTNTKINLAFP